MSETQQLIHHHDRNPLGFQEIEPNNETEPLVINLGNNSFIENYPSRVKEEYKKIICCQLVTFVSRERKFANLIYLIASIWLFICVLIGGSLFSAAMSTVDEADCGASSIIYNECGKSLNCSVYSGKSMKLRGALFQPYMFMVVSNLNRTVDDEKMRHVIELACPELCFKKNEWDFDSCSRADIKVSNICLNYDSEYCLVSELMVEGIYSLIDLKRFDIGVVYAYFIQPFLPLILINILQNIADIALDLIRNTKSLGRILIISILTLISHLLYLIPIIVKYESTFGKWNVFNFVQPLISSFVLLTILEFIMPIFRALYSTAPKTTLGEKLLLCIKGRKNRNQSPSNIVEKKPISERLKMHLGTMRNTLFNSKISTDYSPPNSHENQENQVNQDSEQNRSRVNQENVTRLDALFLLIGYIFLLALFEGLCGIVIAFKIISTSRGYFICITIAYLITSFAFITILCMSKKEKTWIGFIIQLFIMFISFCALVGSFTYAWISFTFQPYSF